jgi:hypothetical protein
MCFFKNCRSDSWGACTARIVNSPISNSSTANSSSWDFCAFVVYGFGCACVYLLTCVLTLSSGVRYSCGWSCSSWRLVGSGEHLSLSSELSTMSQYIVTKGFFFLLSIWNYHFALWLSETDWELQCFFALYLYGLCHFFFFFSFYLVVTPVFFIIITIVVFVYAYTCGSHPWFDKIMNIVHIWTHDFSKSDVACVGCVKVFFYFTVFSCVQCPYRKE